MNTSLEDWKKRLTDIGTQVGQANDLVAQYTGAGYSVPELAKKRTQELYNPATQELRQSETAAQAELMTTPANYAAEFQSGRFAGNPILAGQAAAQREATIQKRLQNIRNTRTSIEGTQTDIINAATAGFQAQTAAVQGVAQKQQDAYTQAKEAYNIAWEEEQARLKAEEQARQASLDERKFQESIRQFNVSEANKKKSGRSSGGSSSSISSIDKSFFSDIDKTKKSLKEDPNLWQEEWQSLYDKYSKYVSGQDLLDLPMKIDVSLGVPESYASQAKGWDWWYNVKNK